MRDEPRTEPVRLPHQGLTARGISAAQPISGQNRLAPLLQLRFESARCAYDIGQFVLRVAVRGHEKLESATQALGRLVHLQYARFVHRLASAPASAVERETVDTASHRLAEFGEIVLDARVGPASRPRHHVVREHVARRCRLGTHGGNPAGHHRGKRQPFQQAPTFHTFVTVVDTLSFIRKPVLPSPGFGSTTQARWRRRAQRPLSRR